MPDFYVELAALKIDQNDIKGAQTLLENESLFVGMVPSVKSHFLKNKLLVAIKVKDFDSAKELINNTLYSISDKSKPIDIDTMTIADYNPGHLLIDISILRDLAYTLEENDTPWNDLPPKLYRMALKHFDANFIQGQLNTGAVKYLDAITRGYLKTETGNNQESLTYFIETYESITSRYLYSKFNQSRYTVQDETTRELLQKEQELRANITFLKRKQARRHTDDVAQQLFEVERLLKNLASSLAVKDSASEEAKNLDFSVKNIDMVNKSYVKFIVAKNMLYRFVINDTGIHLKNLGDYDAIALNVSQFIDATRNPNGQLENYNTLSETLFLGLMEGVSFTNTTYIIPDRVLNYLPFGLLRYKTGYALEKFNISYAIGLSYLQENTSEKNLSKDKVALFAPSYSKFSPSSKELAVRGEPYDLSGAKAEVSEISNIVKSDVYNGGKASKKSFQSLSNDISVIHLSMHSYLNDKDPELSSLVFSDDTDDYNLYISELYGLNFSADLAVLSACNTGVSGYDKGDGIVSMSRAFKYAGVPATVSSLWSAPDLSAKKIMVSFYEHLKEGASKSKALQLAKLDYLENTSEPALKHPYYWAGFVLHGNDAPIALQGENNLWVWALLAILLLVVILFLVAQKRRAA